MSAPPPGRPPLHRVFSSNPLKNQAAPLAPLAPNTSLGRDPLRAWLQAGAQILHYARGVNVRDEHGNAAFVSAELSFYVSCDVGLLVTAILDVQAPTNIHYVPFRLTGSGVSYSHLADACLVCITGKKQMHVNL